MTFSACGRARALAALALGLTVVAGPADAAFILMGSDYFETVQPSFFIIPPGYANAGTQITVQGLPTGPGSTDTIVQRRADCFIHLQLSGDSCTIPIEMVGLSLVAVGNPSLRFRESPTLASAGTMTLFSDGSGSGGSFDSFFDIFIELSLDAGNTWNLFDMNPSNQQFDPLHLQSSGAQWSTVEHGLLVDGLIGDQAANRHTDKDQCLPFGDLSCRDFYLVSGGVVTETDVLATHTARSAVAEPGSLMLASLALAAAGAVRRRSSHIGLKRQA